MKSLKSSISGNLRQCIDCLVCVTALILFAPLFLVIAVSILWEIGRPILFLQTRVGRNGTQFRLVKFRTMRPSSKGLSLTVAGDSRISKVGRVLRKFKLDELPQLWNIVCGDMSLVGPRPEVPEFVNLNEPAWRSVLRVRPGITDPASIAFHEEEKLLAQATDPIRFYRESLLPTKLAMNIAYLRERSWWVDVLVIFRTLQCAVFPGRVDR